MKWHEPNVCDGCEYHIIEHRCTYNSYRGRLMREPKIKCKHRKTPADPNKEIPVESKVPFKETLEMFDVKDTLLVNTKESVVQ